MYPWGEFDFESAIGHANLELVVLMCRCFQSLDRIKRSKVRIKADSMEVGDGPIGLGVDAERWQRTISIAFKP